MKKKFIRQVLMAGALAGFGFSAQASLVVPAGNSLVVNDTDLNITWTQDANLFKTMASTNPNLVNDIAAVMSSYNDQYWGTQSIDAGDFNTSTGQMSWWGAQAWIVYLNSISYGGGTGWRLPTWTDLPGANSFYGGVGSDLGYNSDPSSSEFAHLFFGELGNTSRYDTNGTLRPGLSGVDWGLVSSTPFENLQSYVYWLGNEYYPSASGAYFAWSFETTAGYQSNNTKSNALYGLAVRPGQVAAVPVPAAVWLMGSGLVGLLGWGRRKSGTLALG